MSDENNNRHGRLGAARFRFVSRAVGVPTFDELAPHPRVPGGRILPADGKFVLNGEVWTVRGPEAVMVGGDGEPHGWPASVPCQVTAPMRFTGGTSSAVGLATPLLRTLARGDGRLEVLGAFGLVRRGSA